MIRLNPSGMLDAFRVHVEAFRFRRRYFADLPIGFSRISEFRNERFLKSGPPSWLDQTDAFHSIDEKLASGEIDAGEAEACRTWVVDGYWVAPGLLDGPPLDAFWDACERALSSGLLGKPGLALGSFPEGPSIRICMSQKSTNRCDSRICAATPICSLAGELSPSKRSWAMPAASSPRIPTLST